MKRVEQNAIIIAQRDTKVFIFGDDLSDIGSLFGATESRFPPSPPYFNGRFSNGPIAVEILANQLGLTLNLETNFAIGGATTGRNNLNDTGTQRIGGLLDQVDRFTNRTGSREANSKALYVVWAGANDLISRPSDSDVAVDLAVGNIKTAVNNLVQQGARNIVVVQNPNVGRTPLSLEAGLLDSLTSSTRSFNRKLRTTLTPLEKQLNINVVLTDLFTLSEEIVQNPSRFRFSDVTRPYLRDFVPGDAAADPNQFLFWDRVNPTTKGHATFANTIQQDIVNGIQDDIERIGTRLDDRLIGYSGDDFLDGRGGQDFLEGNRGDDILLGGRGRDILHGSQDEDLLVGGFGNDLLQGGEGSDRLFGLTGQDTLIGGSGIDFLSGGRGDDLLNGGGNCDIFSLRQQGGTDTIQDFEPGTDLIFLPGSLSFDQLDIRQQGKNTLITIASSNQLLGILENVQSNTIGSDNFLGERSNKLLIDLADTEQGAGILEAIKAESTGLNNLLPTRRV